MEKPKRDFVIFAGSKLPKKVEKSGLNFALEVDSMKDGQINIYSRNLNEKAVSNVQQLVSQSCKYA